MKGPSRWISSDSGLEGDLRSLMHYARSRGPTPAQVESLTTRVLAHLKAGGPGCDATRAGGRSQPGRILHRIQTPKSIVCAGLVALGSVALWTSFRNGVDSTPRISARPVKRPAALTTEPFEAPIKIKYPNISNKDQEPKTVEVNRTSKGLHRTARSGSVKTTSEPSDPAAEVLLLQRARRLIAVNPAEALEVVTVHQVRYPEGIFREEREALTIEALQRLGAHDQAAARFIRLIQRYPASAYRPRLESFLRANGAK